MKIGTAWKKISFFLNANKEWKKPQRAEVLIYDEVGSELFLEYLPQSSVAILSRDGKRINIWALLRSLLKKGSYRFYDSSYIELVSPKVVLTFIDNTPAFYLFKKTNPSIVTIFVQNGLRSIVGDIFGYLDRAGSDKTEYHVDYMLCFSKSVCEKYARYISGNTIAIGSFKNNMIGSLGGLGEVRSLLFLSQFRKKPLSQGAIMFENVEWGNFFRPEFYYLPLILSLCNKKNIRLSICGCLNDVTEEVHFFRSLLGNEGWDFIPWKSRESSYQLIDKAPLIVMIDSTLGYEALARGKKVAALTARGKCINAEGIDFGWPMKLPDSGPFWTNDLNEEEFLRIMDYIMNVGDTEWEQLLTQYSAALPVYDPGNGKFISLMQALDVPLK
jgi:surface carbohydrate biosynthesis protein